ncbi:methylated-DNA--[protein]-cysteine S-methyltransferase [Methanobrevibacter sp.]|uniref:methylated-DNA--[protein]-cysteine S-methyltransferase n=1 Tax=Methanobrevibacter sp. TaxID=66852 RepID=UPI00388EBFD1
MINIKHYTSPIGDILLASRNEKLIGSWFEGQKYYLANVSEEIIEKDDETLIQAKEWLDSYFNGEKPLINELDLDPIGTDFRKEVWEILCEIPYGKTTSYKDIANRIAKKRGIEKMSAQAVGGAVGHNPISIIIPCHRVVASNGELTGYAAGIDKKKFLLMHEKD